MSNNKTGEMGKSKKRKTLTMFFHCAGITSEEQWSVKERNLSKTILSEGESEWIFDTITGKCLNDDNTFGARRTIAPL
jgi:hypothetical protein